jgi:hypothetical protein
MLGPMRYVRLVLTMALSLTAAACGGSDRGASDLGAGGDGGGGSASTPRCADGELRVVGSIDGEEVNIVRKVIEHRFVSKSGELGTVDARTAKGTLSMVFEGVMVADSASSDARGAFVDAEGAISVGNCETGDLVSSLTRYEDREGFDFSLRDLHREPYCTGAEVSGVLNGCMSFNLSD